ncbi:hypothetical protein E0355_10785 [Escherichia coli]|nr:hypothetical protein [Escherichia coli]EFA4581322.1 hypothetical protein [Escherichia coli]EFC2151623.1 hypothetical protein [Escherichia coli]EFH6853036.1 hypothetical protein [Escherichia coli]EFI3812674.1 hypothetical protein [Escherichia coli]
MMFVHCPLHVISIARKVSLQLCLYTVVSISRSQCAGQKNIAKSGAGTQNRIEVAGKKNAALFEWAAFVKAEK